MSSDFSLEPRDGYLYVQLASGFEMTPDSTARVWIAICETCREKGFRRALAVGENVTRRLTPTEASDIASLAGRLLPGLSVACVLHGYVPDEQSRLFQAAAVNRGVRMEFFPDLNAALHWLGLGARTLD